MAGIAKGLKCPVCAAEDRADSKRRVCETRQQSRRGISEPPRRAACLLAPSTARLLGVPSASGTPLLPLLEKSQKFPASAWIATRRLLGQAPGSNCDESGRHVSYGNNPLSAVDGERLRLKITSRCTIVCVIKCNAAKVYSSCCGNRRSGEVFNCGV